MKRIVTHLSLLAASAIFATGCVPVRHNLPPEQRLMEPGPGVGGPGPGVLGPPAVAPGGMMGGPAMMGAAGMGAAGMGGPGMGGAGMGGAAACPPGQTAAAAGEDNSEVQPVAYQTCGPDCSECGGTGACGAGGVGSIGGGADGANVPPGGGVLRAGGAGAGGALGAPVPPTVQVTFGRPDGMHVRFDVTGTGVFDSEPLVVPARQNFPQGGLFRIKLTNVPTRPGVELYPTLELAYANPRTGAYLAHNSIPIQFTEEDFDQVLTGNFVTKVIYLPDPDFQGPALAGIDTLVSTRLDPGIDPIVEADRRGSILAIVRLGDKDIEMAGAEGGLAASSGIAPPIAGLPAPFAPAMTEGCGGPGAGGNGVAHPPRLPGNVAGVTAPQYGMPRSGTPIGLAGPPHIPLGAPAGLKKHVIKNHTPRHLPRPVNKVKADVRLQPGFSYPNPVSRIHISEQNVHPGVPAGRPRYQKASQPVH